ncbi:MAG: amino acid permease [Acidobacteria bacterium]|nr:MAG: amino acid permease [Acidobacteriota bacterium]
MASASAARESSLVRAIGVVGLAAGIVNVTIGGGIFRLPADVARALGPAAPLAYLACALAMGLIVLCFAEAGSRVDLTGGPYAYVETAFGPFVGFLAGAVFWIESTLAMAAVSVVFVAHAGQLLPAIGGGLASAAFLAAVFVVLSAVNIAGVRKGTAVNTIAAAAKLLPLVLLLAAGPFFVEPRHLAWTSVPPAAAVSRTSILLVFVFAGMECALAPSGEVRDVARTVPRAITLAMATVTLVYVGVQLVAQGVLGADLAAARTPLADVAARMFGAPGRTLLLLGATVSMLGYVSGMILAVPRALFAFARDGFLPGALAAVHPRFHTPHVAIAAQSAITCLLAITSTFERLAILATATTLCLYAACCLAAWQLRRRDVRAGGIPFHVPAGGVVPWAACLAIAWMLTSVTAPEWAALAGALALATVVFLATARHRARNLPILDPERVR